MDRGASYKITWAMFFCNLSILLHHTNLKNYFNGDGNPIYFILKRYCRKVLRVFTGGR